MPDLNRDPVRPVWRAGPQPRAYEASVACRASTAKWSERRMSERLSEALSERMSDRMSERMSEDVSERMPETMSERMSDIMSEDM